MEEIIKVERKICIIDGCTNLRTTNGLTCTGRRKYRLECSSHAKKRYSIQTKSYASFFSKTPKGRMIQYRSGAKKRHIDFQLTYEQFMGLWQSPCYYCQDSIQTIGIDRVDNNKGYILENIVACCSLCNKMKMILAQQPFIEHCKKIASNF